MINLELLYISRCSTCHKPFSNDQTVFVVLPFDKTTLVVNVCLLLTCADCTEKIHYGSLVIAHFRFQMRLYEQYLEQVFALAGDGRFNETIQ